MKLIVGLGNPGEKFKETRHNVGFMVVEDLSRTLRAPAFGFEKRFKSEVIGSQVDGETILLVKPQTFMNNSGEAVAAILQMYKDRVDLSDLWVVHDDIDLPLGRMKIQKGGGSAGHHGIESVVKLIGRDDFVRVRVGIRTEEGKAETFVLTNFTSEEQKQFDQTIEKTVESILFALREGVEKAMTHYNAVFVD